MRYFRSLQALRGQLGVEAEMRFVFESGPEPGQGYLIGLDVVGDLYRVADVLFMPSHREGFGMPIVEAGFMGLAIVASTAVPAAEEIADEAAMHIDLADPAEDVACRIWRMAQTDARLTLRRRIRQQLTWQAIFNQQIKPMLYGPGDDDSAT
jgi:glycosyltransferase involved in cell wall biosynthesis